MDDEALTAALLRILKDRADLSVSVEHEYEAYSGKYLRVTVELSIDGETILKGRDSCMIRLDD